VGGQKVDKEGEEEYVIVTLDFIAGGGDNILPAYDGFVSLQTADEVLDAYIKKTTPVNIQLEGRITETDFAEDSEAAGGGDGAIGASEMRVVIWMAIGMVMTVFL
jgi:hypothetical protein